MFEGERERCRRRPHSKSTTAIICCLFLLRFPISVLHTSLLSPPLPRRRPSMSSVRTSLTKSLSRCPPVRWIGTAILLLLSLMLSLGFRAHGRARCPGRLPEGAAKAWAKLNRSRIAVPIHLTGGHLDRLFVKDVLTLDMLRRRAKVWGEGETTREYEVQK